MSYINIKNKFNRLNNMINTAFSPKISKFQKIRIAGDYFFNLIFFRVRMLDYFQYGFYYRKRADKKRFITFDRLLTIINICNSKKERYIFDSKPEFNKVFGEFLGREWLDMSSANYEDFKLFAERHSTIFVKRPQGMFGQGVSLIKVAEIESLEKAYQELKEEKALMEEVINQHLDLAEFNPSSANTLRLVTLLCEDNTVKVMAAVLRIGRKGKVADNFHHKGIAAIIDIETGIVITPGVDNEYKRYVIHPDSQKPIVGFKIPKWEDLLIKVKKAALIIPSVRYVGWDVTVDKNGVIMIIEGNFGPDPDVLQIPDGIGKWPLYEPYIAEIDELTNKH